MSFRRFVYTLLALFVKVLGGLDSFCLFITAFPFLAVFVFVSMFDLVKW